MAGKKRGQLLAPSAWRRVARRRIVFFLCALFCFLHTLPDVALYVRDTRQAGKLDEELTAGLNDPVEIARALQAAVMERVKFVSKKGRFFDLAHRPKLRQRAMETWDFAEGQCGEGARLLVILLEARNLRATRLILSNSHPEFYHTAVAFFAEGNWWLLDSIGSPRGFREWSLANRLPLKDLLGVKMHTGGSLLISENNPFFSRYSHFPWARLVGENVEMNQFFPPPHWMTVLLENPPLAMAVTKVVCWTGVAFLFLVLLFCYRTCQRVITWSANAENRSKAQANHS